MIQKFMLNGNTCLHLEYNNHQCIFNVSVFIMLWLELMRCAICGLISKILIAAYSLMIAPYMYQPLSPNLPAIRLYSNCSCIGLTTSWILVCDHQCDRHSKAFHYTETERIWHNHLHLQAQVRNGTTVSCQLNTTDLPLPCQVYLFRKFLGIWQKN